MSLINTLIKAKLPYLMGIPLNLRGWCSFLTIHLNTHLYTTCTEKFVYMLIDHTWRITTQTRNMTARNWSVEETKLILETQKELNDVSGLDGRKQCSNEEAGAGGLCITLAYRHRGQRLVLAFTSSLLPTTVSMHYYYSAWRRATITASTALNRQ